MVTNSNSDSEDKGTSAGIPETVLCFDRDHTITVNPHPEHRAVPLSWVKYLAHERDDVTVWATGNQKLCEEASIPGVSEAISCWRHLTYPENIDRFHKFVPPGARKPGRRESLHLIRAIYDEIATPAEIPGQFVVVDDIDLTDLASDGWTHYFPWDFVTRAEIDMEPVQLPVPLENVSDVPVSDPACPESYPPFNYDEPRQLSYVFSDRD